MAAVLGQPLVILPHLQKQAAYNATADFAPVGMISVASTLLVTHPSRPFRTVAELVAHARTQPGRLDYASAGNGSVTDLAMALFTSMAGVNITHVPNKGAPQGLADVFAAFIRSESETYVRAVRRSGLKADQASDVTAALFASASPVRGARYRQCAKTDRNRNAKPAETR
jgi:tripartite-type tricarboxylate transporter receptor subunit TctC